MKPLTLPLRAALLLACTLAAAPALAEHREHGPHVHGVGQLNVVLDGNTLEIGLDGPAANLIGFEHAPRDAAERATLEQTVAHLRDAAAVFTLPSAAACRAEAVQLESSLLDHETGEEHHGDRHDHGAPADHDGDGHDHDGGEEHHHHADLEATWRFRCERPAALDAVTVQLFRLFPATHQLEVQLLTPRGQRGTTLTADSPRLRF
jgi:hypothetical protein